MSDNPLADDNEEHDDNEPNWDCPGCQGGDKWLVDQDVWICPVCDTEYKDKDATNE